MSYIGLLRICLIQGADIMTSNTPTLHVFKTTGDDSCYTGLSTLSSAV